MAINDPTLASPAMPTAPPAALPSAAPVDPYDITQETNKSKVLSLVRDKLSQWSKGGRETHIRNGWRNILFSRGHQWLVYDRGRAWWRPIDVKKYTGPRPVTNVFAYNMDAFCNVLGRIEPTLSFRPATDEPEDRATAEIADRVIEVCEDECNIRMIRQALAKWCGYTDGAWLESGYDPSPEHGTRLEQDDACVACGATGPPQATPECTVCGGPTQPAVDAAGQPQGRQVPIGKMYTEVASLFEMYFDASKADWKTGVREYIRKKSSDKDEVTRRWGAAAEGVSGDMGPSPSEAFADQLSALAGYQAETGPGAGLLQRGTPGNRVSEAYYWALPTDDYPEGLLAVVVGGSTVVHIGPLPYEYDNNQPFLPTVYFPIGLVPGTLYSKTPADDLALKQIQRNKLEAHLEMTMNRMAWPIWLIPEGANVSTFSGEPGQLLKYSAIGTNGAKPERMQGAGLPNGAITWLMKIDSDMEQITATFAGTKGDHPTGVSAGISLQMIEDRKNQRFGSMYILWEQAWAEWARQQLAIFRQFATEPRLLKIQGRGSQWRIQQFLGSDITGRIDIVAEPGSAAPRSTLVERAETEQLFATGTLNSQDPEIQQKVLESYGRLNWLPSMQADAETAAKQIQVFEGLAQDPRAVQVLGALLQQAAVMQQKQNAAVQQAQAAGMAPQALPPPLPPITYDQIVGSAAQQQIELPEVRPMVDGHAILARELGAWLKGDASQRLPKPIQKVVELKHMEHMLIAQQRAMETMQMRQGTYPTSGFLSNPGGQQGPNQGPQGAEPTPPANMQGQMHEMQASAA